MKIILRKRTFAAIHTKYRNGPKGPHKIIYLTEFFITYTGYRLAFNYLKAKRLVDAIDVCHKVHINLISFCIDVSLTSTVISIV